MDTILRLVFERTPLALFNGYKRKLGNVLLVGAGVLQVVSQVYAIPFAPEVLAYIGAATRVLGDMHDQAKGN